jgi:cytochrome c oxidase cbb3-type subunit I
MMATNMEEISSPTVPVTSGPEDSEQRATIDRSVKGPVLLMFVAAVKWLVIACLLGFCSSLVFSNPIEGGGLFYWFHYGRLEPAWKAALLYGWAIPAGLSVGMWIMARIARVPLRRPGLLYFGIFAWNTLVTIGVLAILFGGNTSLNGMEFPGFIAPPLFFAFLILGSPIIAMFQSRRPGATYISQWYLVGAVVWFSLVFLASYMFLHAGSAKMGVMGAGIAAWYSSNLIYLFLAPVGLASAYYFIPKITGTAIHSYHYAIVGFLALAVLAPWTGFHYYLGGPFPEWIPTISGVAVILMLIPAAMVAINHHRTTSGHWSLMQISPTLRFVIFGSVAYTIFNIVASLGSVGLFIRNGQFTMAQQGVSLLAMFPFFTMSMFGAMYFIVPRLTGCEWLSRRMIRFHFWTSAWSFGFLVLLLLVGGYTQGEFLNQRENWNMPVITMVSSIKGYVTGMALIWFLAVISSMVFFLHLVLMALGLGRRSSSPTLLGQPGDH